MEKTEEDAVPFGNRPNQKTGHQTYGELIQEALEPDGSAFPAILDTGTVA